MGWMSGWTYRRYFTVDRPAGVSAETDYPVPIRVGESAGAAGYDLHCAGHCKSDFSDVRITLADGETTMPLRIESVSGVSPNQTALVWVLFPSIGANTTTAHLYYGRAAAEAVSSISATFPDFSEDFSGTSLNAAKWTAALEGSGGITVSGGVLRLNCPDGATNRAKITSKTEFSYNTAIRCRMRFKKFSANPGPANLRVGYIKDSPAMNRLHYYYNGTAPYALWYSVKNGKSEQKLDNCFASEVYAVVDCIRETSAKAVYAFNGSVRATHQTFVPDNALPIVFDADNDLSGVAWYIDVDWVVVRKVVSPEPVFGNYGLEERRRGIAAIEQYYRRLRNG
jgi:hypothetical protein